MFDVDATDTALQLFITLEVKDEVDQFLLANAVVKLISKFFSAR